MSDEIKDLDDVEAHAWAAAMSAGLLSCDATLPEVMADALTVADQVVQSLRERRAKPSAATMVSLATQLAAACGREANAVAVERAKVVAWLRAAADRVEVLPPERGEIGDKWKHADAVAGHLRITACAIERGEHDR